MLADDGAGVNADDVSAEGDDDDLTCENERGNQQETAGGGNMREGGAMGAKAIVDFLAKKGLVK